MLIVLIDDAGFGVPDTFGGFAHTPTLSRLRDEGISYNRFHTTSICSPTRAALRKQVEAAREKHTQDLQEQVEHRDQQLEVAGDQLQAEQAGRKADEDLAASFLRLINVSRGTRDLIQAVTGFFQQQSGCQAVGVRLKVDDDYPYYETDFANCLVKTGAPCPHRFAFNSFRYCVHPRREAIIARTQAAEPAPGTKG